MIGTYRKHAIQTRKLHYSHWNKCKKCGKHRVMAYHCWRLSFSLMPLAAFKAFKESCVALRRGFVAGSLQKNSWTNQKEHDASWTIVEHLPLFWLDGFEEKKQTLIWEEKKENSAHLGSPTCIFQELSREIWDQSPKQTSVQRHKWLLFKFWSLQWCTFPRQHHDVACFKPWFTPRTDMFINI